VSAGRRVSIRGCGARGRSPCVCTQRAGEGEGERGAAATATAAAAGVVVVERHARAGRGAELRGNEDEVCLRVDGASRRCGGVGGCPGDIGGYR
jgi:hypothetical protein